MVAGWLVGSTNADICKWKKEPRLSVDLCTWRNDCCCWSTLLHCSLVVTLKSKDGDGEKTGKDKAGQWNKAAKRKKTLAKTNFRFDVTFFPLLPHWLNRALNSLPNLRKKGEWKKSHFPLSETVAAQCSSTPCCVAAPDSFADGWKQQTLNAISAWDAAATLKHCWFWLVTTVGHCVVAR